MPSKKYIFAIIFVAFLGAFNTANATGYNYLPDDVYIKQQQEKSALEYRIKSLESQISGSPQISILTIDQRIAELRQEWEDQKTYTTGMIAHNGAGSPELYSSAIAKIDSKYSSQISSLEAQKSQYQQQINNQAEIDKEIAKIQQQIKEIDEYYDKQRDAVLKQLQLKTTVKPTVYLPDSNDPQVMFSYLDSLPAQEASNASKELLRAKPQLYEVVLKMWLKAYPNGKVGTAMYDEYVESLKQEISVTSNPPKQTIVKPKNVEKKIEQEVKSIDVEKVDKNQSTNTPTSTLQQKVNKPEQPKENFVQKVVGFFKRIAFWK